MNRNYFIKIFFILFVFYFIGCDEDVINNENGDIINNGNENSNNNGNDTTNETPNNGNENSNNGNGDNVVNDKIYLLKGTIWYADSGSLFIEFPDNHLNLILFRNYQYFGSSGGNLNGNVTLGNFRISSYDGETMKLLNYDNLEVPFTVIISDNKMTVDGLNAIKWTAPPLRERDFRSYNRTYTKDEEKR